ncbi:hypothetical protein COT78_02920 [Candidatus Berkelbacteria bacterium CG10_big_fil_rev_8_21_14_0_10_43_13]|uniref:Glutamyl-tRNA amidotransferase n=1 Tax=Candidatus Berkelbacteria bacterium CG10_big_fil_rev_8_21_14_0_10_43_13 TaxID=1974514 RepID=A0A2H0W6C3_9BACT|nr:MAG: hypothetical protein COT78_02920 [Candidatus Berkelbacteria bacterium CG10_big_fil_rev_8_21_14_0_10_43_13]
MSLKSQIESDFLTAYKNRDDLKVSILRMMKSAIKNAEISAKADLSDDEIVKILRREAKQREEAIVEFEKGGRSDLTEGNRKEIAVIDEYLPAQIDSDQIQKVIDETVLEINPSGPADFGRVIGAVMKKLAGQADGNTVSTLVKKALEQKQK